MRARWAVLVLVLAVAAAVAGGCADTAGDVVSSTPSPTPSGEDAFVADVQAAGFGTLDTSMRPDVLKLGHTVCDVLTRHISEVGPEGLYTTISTLRMTAMAPTQDQADAVTRSAAANLCPQNADALPSSDR